jgi:hypothetical protein
MKAEEAPASAEIQAPPQKSVLQSSETAPQSKMF